MKRINPLLVDTWNGLGRAGRIQLDYLNYLLIQALVLLLAWPKTTVSGWLAAETGPVTLLAVVVAVGISVAYYSLRAGAEEVLLRGQHSLLEWRLATSLKPGGILCGYLAGHLLQTVHVVALSLPLLMLGFAVSGSDWAGFGWSVIAVLFQASFYRLLGAIMALALRQREQLLFFAVRAALLLGYLVTWKLLPVANHWVLSSQLLAGGPWRYAMDFLLVYTGLCALLAGALYRLLDRQR